MTYSIDMFAVARSMNLHDLLEYTSTADVFSMCQDAWAFGGINCTCPECGLYARYVGSSRRDLSPDMFYCDVHMRLWFSGNVQEDDAELRGFAKELSVNIELALIGAIAHRVAVQSAEARRRLGEIRSMYTQSVVAGAWK